MSLTFLFRFSTAGLLAVMGSMCLHAATIGSATFQSGELAAGTFNSMFSRLSIGPPGALCFAAPPCTEIFSRTFTTADVGSTFMITGASNPNMSTVIAFLTDGINDSLGTGASFTGPVANPGGGFGYTEAGSFFPNAGGPDFAGLTIADLRLAVNSVSFTPMQVPFLTPPFPPGTQGIVSVTLFVDGTVAVPDPGAVATPEPGTGVLVLLSAAIAPILLRKRR
jgi:hypothetical protein